jgi:DNA glycosylase AlkZ-like
VRYTVPLVFTPPRGTWQGRGPVTLTTFEAWLGRPPGPAAEPERLVTRYLAAFGPASVADMRAWSGLALRTWFEKLRPKLVVFRDERGVELFDLPRAPRPVTTTVPLRLIPDYDNILLGHADRTRIMPAGRHLGMFSSNGVMQGAVLVDGFVRAMWTPRAARGATTLEVAPFERPLARAARPEVEEEAAALLRFLAPGDRYDVRYAAVRP